MSFQILTSVPVLPLTTVTLMLHVTIFLGASPVDVTKVTLEMGSLVKVCILIKKTIGITYMSCQILMSVPVLPLTTVTLMLHVPTLLGASPVDVTKVTLEMEPLVKVHPIKQTICIHLHGCHVRY